MSENNLSTQQNSQGTLNTADLKPGAPSSSSSAASSSSPAKLPAGAAGLPPAFGTPSTNQQQQGSAGSFHLPRMQYHDTIVAAVPRKVFANAHAYHINSISINSDDETFLSADDLRINLWNTGISEQSFSAF